MERQLEELLRCEAVGPLTWQPPEGISRTLDGSRRGVPDGFSVRSWGPSRNGGAHPRLTERSLSFAEAIRVARALDDIGTTPHDRSPRGYASAVAWVQAIVAAVPVAYEEAVSEAEARLARLRETRAEAQGFAAALAAASPEPERDEDVPF